MTMAHEKHSKGTLAPNQYETPRVRRELFGFIMTLCLIFSAPAGWQAAGDVFPPRWDHAAVSFHGKVWLMGGTDGAPRNDIWCSAEGRFWQWVPTARCWSPRSGHKAVVFQDQIWVLGGGTGAETGEVWRSPDASNWELVTSSAPWANWKRYDALIFNDRIWMLGYPDNISQPRRVWSSTDGLTWVQEDETGWLDFPKPCVLGERLVNFSRSLEILTMHTSHDGIHWNTESTTDATSRSYYNLQAFRGEAVLLPQDSFNDLTLWTLKGDLQFSRIDVPGQDWQFMWLRDGGVSWVVHGDELWAISGHSAGSSLYVFDPYVWVTRDLVHWEERISRADQATEGPIVAHAGRLYQAGLRQTRVSDDGTLWSIAGQDLVQPSRIGSAVASFRNQLWLAGGTHNPARGISLADLWTSSDGTTWTRVLEQAPWGGRYAHSLIAFDDKLWVIGGKTNSVIQLHDVWNSEDGTSWTLVADNLSIGLEANRPVLVHNSRMLYLRPQPSGSKWNCYETTNGQQWTLHVANLPRMGAYDGGMGIVSWRGGMWGLFKQQQLFYSQNGWDWSLFSDRAPFCTQGNIDLVGTPEQLLAIGANDRGSSGWETPRRIWSSSNGHNWKRPHLPIWSARRNARCAEFNNELWLLGGDFGSQASFNDIWAMNPAGQWRCETGLAPWAKRSGHAAITFKNRLFVIGGIASQGDAWATDNGTTWTLVAANHPVTNRQHFACVNFQNRLWVLGGRGGSPAHGLTDAWSSDDGISWTQQATQLWEGRPAVAGAVYQDRIWVITDGSDLWSSADGREWRKESGHPLPRNTSGHAMTTAFDRLWIQLADTNQLWFTRDGIQWTPSSARQPWSVRRSTTLANFRGKLVLLGGADSGNYLSKADTWVLADPAEGVENAVDALAWRTYD